MLEHLPLAVAILALIISLVAVFLLGRMALFATAIKQNTDENTRFSVELSDALEKLRANSARDREREQRITALEDSYTEPDVSPEVGRIEADQDDRASYAKIGLLGDGFDAPQLLKEKQSPYVRFSGYEKLTDSDIANSGEEMPDKFYDFDRRANSADVRRDLKTAIGAPADDEFYAELAETQANKEAKRPSTFEHDMLEERVSILETQTRNDLDASALRAEVNDLRERLAKAENQHANFVLGSAITFVKLSQALKKERDDTKALAEISGKATGKNGADTIELRKQLKTATERIVELEEGSGNQHSRISQLETMEEQLCKDNVARADGDALLVARIEALESIGPAGTANASRVARLESELNHLAMISGRNNELLERMGEDDELLSRLSVRVDNQAGRIARLEKTEVDGAIWKSLNRLASRVDVLEKANGDSFNSMKALAQNAERVATEAKQLAFNSNKAMHKLEERINEIDADLDEVAEREGATAKKLDEHREHASQKHEAVKASIAKLSERTDLLEEDTQLVNVIAAARTARAAEAQAAN